MLHLVGVEDGDRVTVSNLDHGALEDIGCEVGRWSREDEEEEYEDQGEAGLRAIHLKRPKGTGTLWGKQSNRGIIFCVHQSIWIKFRHGGKNDLRGIRKPRPSVRSYNLELRTEESGIRERILQRDQIPFL